MQSMWLCICVGVDFEETFENPLWWKNLKMQSMQLCIWLGRQFEKTFEDPLWTAIIMSLISCCEIKKVFRFRFKFKATQSEEMAIFTFYSCIFLTLRSGTSGCPKRKSKTTFRYTRFRIVIFVKALNGWVRSFIVVVQSRGCTSVYRAVSTCTVIEQQSEI